MIKLKPKVALFSEKSKRNSRTQSYKNPIAVSEHSTCQLPENEQLSQRFKQTLQLGIVVSIYKGLCKGGDFRRKCDKGDQQL